MARAVKGRFNKKAIILLYHRVSDVRPDPWSLCVTPKHFSEHLEILQKYAHPIALQRLVAALNNMSTLLPRTVVVTFDDGYRDNLTDARLLLEQHDIPATVFLVSGYLEQEREFWWDELERLLLQPGSLPAILELKIKERNYRWQLGVAANYNEDAYRQHHLWRVGEAPPGVRHSLYYSLWKLLRPLFDEERSEVLKDLAAWANVECAVRPTHRTLSGQDIFSLAQGKLIAIGAHTVTHPRLSELSSLSQMEEIRRCKSRLEEIINRPVTSFSYPFGSRADYTAETVALVREEGFTCACANFSDLVSQKTDLLQLPRVYVEDWCGEEFAKRIAYLFDD